MRSLPALLFACLLAGILLVRCVDPVEQTSRQNVDVIVMEGSITNLAEPQVIYLNRSFADSLTGRFSTLPLSGATVEIVVDSSVIIPLKQTDPGRYQAPTDFMGQIGHTYQLRFTLSNKNQYQSTLELMPAVPPIKKVSEHFNQASLPQGLAHEDRYRAANDIYIDWQDPVDQHNYYRWDWRLWEKQAWCHTCGGGWYIIYDLDDKDLVENCFSSPITNPGSFVNDYACRTNCWQIIHNFDTNVFDDRFSNGGFVQGRLVAQIPYYQDRGCLVEIRQTSLTQNAYQYFKLAQDQTQTTGGLADTPPTVLVGNIKNVNNRHEGVIGYFTASAVSSARYWLDRKANTGTPPGLFYAQNSRKVSPEDLEYDPNDGTPKPKFPFTSKRYSRPPTAPCLEGDNTTPTKPIGWRD